MSLTACSKTSQSHPTISSRSPHLSLPHQHPAGLTIDGYTFQTNIWYEYLALAQDTCDIYNELGAGNNTGALDIFFNGQNAKSSLHGKQTLSYGSLTLKVREGRRNDRESLIVMMGPCTQCRVSE